MSNAIVRDPGHSAATPASAASLRPDRTTLAPAAANARASPAPMPDDAPVIHTVLPAKLIASSLLSNRPKSYASAHRFGPPASG